MRRSIILLEQELIKLDELIKKCDTECGVKCENDKCQLIKDKNQLSKDIQTLYRGK